MHRFEPETFGFAPAPLLEVILQDEDATRRLGAAVAELVADGGFVGLIGELGAGKTTFAQGLVAALHPGGDATSPTYTLLNEYGGEPPIFHFDLYRLGSADELETVGYWDYAEDPRAVVLVEWIDRVPAAWFGRGAVIALAHDSGRRTAAIWVTHRAEHWRGVAGASDDLS